MAILNACILSWSEIAWVAVRSRGSVARAPAAKAGGPGFDSRWLPWVFSLLAGLLMLMGTCHIILANIELW